MKRKAKVEEGPMDRFFKKRAAAQDESSSEGKVEEGLGTRTAQEEEVVQDETIAEASAMKPIGLGNLAVNSNATWLAAMTLPDAQACWKLYRSCKGVRNKCRLDPQQQEKLTSLRAVDPATGRNGKWYLQHITCEVAELEASSSGHPRWQVRLEEGPLSVGQRLKRTISARAWESLIAYTKYLKVEVHHVAYNADLRRETAPIPSNVGAGGSISHLCDEVGCCKASHLEATPIHKDNLDRQRCTGILLLHFKDVIVQEVPCSHGQKRGTDLESQLTSSCVQHIQLVEISSGAFAAMQRC